AAAGRLVSFGRQWCAEHGVTDPEFNLGGGMAVDYARPDGVFDWAGYGRGLAALARPGETLRIEPGRAVTAYCGWYLTRVLDVKHSHGEAFRVVGGGNPQPPHARGQGPRPAVRGHWGGGLDAVVAAARRERAGRDDRGAAVHAEGRAGPAGAGEPAAGR